MSIGTFIKEMRQLDELQDFAEAQYRTILDLTKKNHALEEEIKKLKTITGTSEGTEVSPLLGYTLDVPNEQIISEVQIKKLSKIAFARELTLEEAKRLQIFCKILTDLKSGTKKEKDIKADTFDTADLLKLVDDVSSK